MDYIATVISKNDQVEIISASGVLGKSTDSAKLIELRDEVRLRLFTSIGRRNKLIGKISSGLTRTLLLLYLLYGTHAGEPVIVYHSLAYKYVIFVAHKLRKFRMILELEEIYQDVVACSKFIAYWERKVIASADGYILATEALSKQIPEGRPFIVINGTYKFEPPRNVHFDDNKIHCVYAGTFDPTKGGAAAAAAAAFLPQNYHVHILGFGTEEQTENIKKRIAEVQMTANCTVTYDGLKSGEEFIQFLQKCHIGLCTQIPDAKYTETSFPSKILVYLANGLRVLSVRIPAVEQSDVGDMLFYYDEQKPERIAEAIQNIDVDLPYDSRQRLKELDERATCEMKEIIRKVSK